MGCNFAVRRVVVMPLVVQNGKGMALRLSRAGYSWRRRTNKPSYVAVPDVAAM